MERADGGTLFLDEVSELPLELQPKLLRVLEDGMVTPLHGTPVHSNFRVLAATNRDLKSDVDAGKFRSDLYYRLAVDKLVLPPLSDRLEDLSDLVQAFLEDMESETGIVGANKTPFDEEAFLPLRENEWAGNVRELRNIITRAVLQTRGDRVTRQIMEKVLNEERPKTEPVRQETTLVAIERRAIINALIDSRGHRAQVARRLGIAESTLYEKIKKHGLEDVGRGL